MTEAIISVIVGFIIFLVGYELGCSHERHKLIKTLETGRNRILKTIEEIKKAMADETRE